MVPVILKEKLKTADMWAPHASVLGASDKTKIVAEHTIFHLEKKFYAALL
jgi:hypothetical protein